MVFIVMSYIFLIVNSRKFPGNLFFLNIYEYFYCLNYYLVVVAQYGNKCLGYFVCLFVVAYNKNPSVHAHRVEYACTIIVPVFV